MADLHPIELRHLSTRASCIPVLAVTRKEHIELALRLLDRIRDARDPRDATEELMSCVADLLVEMPLGDVCEVREALVSRLFGMNFDGNDLLTLIDGHLAYRELVGR